MTTIGAISAPGLLARLQRRLPASLTLLQEFVTTLDPLGIPQHDLFQGRGHPAYSGSIPVLFRRSRVASTPLTTSTFLFGMLARTSMRVRFGIRSQLLTRGIQDRTCGLKRRGCLVRGSDGQVGGPSQHHHGEGAVGGVRDNQYVC